MIRTATLADLAAIAELLRDANDAPYDVTKVVAEKCFGPGMAGAPSTRLFTQKDQPLGIAVTCGKYLRILAVRRAVRRQGIGSRLLADAEALGARIAFAEPGNYFTPGVADAGMIAFLRARGYRELQSVWNLHVGIRESRFEIRKEVAESRISNPASLVPFVQREFGPAWAFECARATQAFYVENIGFAVIEANNRGLGSFGPCGVARPFYGKGYGGDLVRVALTALRDLGYSRAIIPWTEATEFYRRTCGAEPAHRFVIWGRDLY